ncbi:hypothetical protein MJ581_11385 [Escherichia coli]|nr:hypothetical protein MJ581_11385 [Escherichia coli]
MTLSVAHREGAPQYANGIYYQLLRQFLRKFYSRYKAGVYQVTATLENGDSMQQTDLCANVANAETAGSL